MENFKYILDRSSRKFTCPACEQKRFVRYINVETGDNRCYLTDNSRNADRQVYLKDAIQPKPF